MKLDVLEPLRSGTMEAMEAMEAISLQKLIALKWHTWIILRRLFKKHSRRLEHDKTSDASSERSIVVQESLRHDSSTKHQDERSRYAKRETTLQLTARR